MRKVIFTGVIFLISVFYATVFSQSLNKGRLDSLFNILAEKNKAMGSVVISKNGQVLYSRAIGYAYISGREKKVATNDTRYRIGSISKMFTATMVFQLIEEGKITLATTLNQYFPAVPNAEKITIGNLLNHRSGIHNFTNDSDYISWMTRAKTPDEMLAIIAKNKPDFQPNERTAYSNSNFVLLGYIIEKITKQTYATALAQRVTGKLALTNPYYGGKTDVNKHESYSYQFINNWKQEPETDMSIPGGAGAIVSTPADLARFIEGLFSLKLVNANSLAQMKTITAGLGMGMFQLPFYNRRAYGHNGSIDGFGATLAYFPEDSITVAYCSNGQVYPLNNILIGILSIVYNRPDYSIPDFKTFALSAEELDKYPGVYSSTQIPLKITITKSNLTLMAQATGQAAFVLEPAERDLFKFDHAGVEIKFDTLKNEFTLKQGGGSYLFIKDK
jgi:CubicO group peptidase (beta-lactamase class C family)